VGNLIIAYSIHAAIASRLFDKVMVSTDCEDIVAISKEYDASMPFMRSSKTSDDFSTTADVLFEVLDNYSNQGKTFLWICCIYPTAPFVTAEKLRAAFDSLRKNDADALLPVVPFSYPPLRGLEINSNFYR